MFKSILIIIALLPLSALANIEISPNYFVGKWDCQTKNNNDGMTQSHLLHFSNNGKMRENLYVYYGKKTDYDYQIETALIHSNWQIINDDLIYSDYKINHYKVQMPNAEKDDLQQATIAVEKSLPIIQTMMDNKINKRTFHISIIDKKSFLMNDIDSMIFMTCHKKGLFASLL